MLENLLVWYPVFLKLLAVVGVLVLFDWITGTAVAIKNKVFVWRRVADILEKWLPIVLGWAIIDALQVLPVEIMKSIVPKTAIDLVYMGVILSIGASIVGHVQALGVKVDLTKVGLPPTPKE